NWLIKNSDTYNYDGLSYDQSGNHYARTSAKAISYDDKNGLLRIQIIMEAGATGGVTTTWAGNARVNGLWWQFPNVCSRYFTYDAQSFYYDLAIRPGETKSILIEDLGDGGCALAAATLKVNVTLSEKSIFVPQEPDKMIFKKTTGSGANVSGAKMVVWEDKDKNGIRECPKGECLADWKTSDYPNGKEVTGLEIGKEYIYSEYQVPDSTYVRGQDIRFTYTGSGTLTMINFKIAAAKHRNTVSGSRLAGARIQIIKKSTGAVVFEYTTNDSATVLENLEEGETYIVHEVSAPAGWKKSPDFEFVPNSATANSGVHIVDVPLKIGVRKHVNSIENNAWVAGAEFAVYAGKATSGTPVGTYTTDSSGYFAMDNLVQDGEYTIVETKTPNGYATMRPYTFIANQDAISSGIHLVNYRDIFINKVSANGTHVPGARLLVWFDGDDSEINKPVADKQYNCSDGGCVWEIESSDYPNGVRYQNFINAGKGLVVGKTYYVREIRKPGNTDNDKAGYVQSEQKAFVFGIDTEVLMRNYKIN
ncbi:MAG: hypothetical protein IJ875_05735, partial [Solobacterium sp.]|nr:hypothetical protein [Solobacterium sp.]